MSELTVDEMTDAGQWLDEEEILRRAISGMSADDAIALVAYLAAPMNDFVPDQTSEH